SKIVITVLCSLFVSSALSTLAQRAAEDDPVKVLAGRLDLEKYKATIKGLTQFGDRREGTERNRKAIDWIEAQLKGYGCANTERIKYTTMPAANQAAGGQRTAAGQRATPSTPTVIASGQVVAGQGGSRLRGIRGRTGVNTDPNAQPDEKL